MATFDRQTYDLAMALQNALRAAEQTDLETCHQLGLRLCQHLIVQYQGHTPEARDHVALSPWQERRAKQILASVRQDKLLIAEVASQCAMSRSHFSRAFKKSTGLSPQEWSLKSRIQRAQQLLAEGSLPMCHIALECGFADQSHFSRTFSKLAGTSPKRWQRNHATLTPLRCESTAQA